MTRIDQVRRILFALAESPAAILVWLAGNGDLAMSRAVPPPGSDLAREIALLACNMADIKRYLGGDASLAGEPALNCPDRTRNGCRERCHAGFGECVCASLCHAPGTACAFCDPERELCVLCGGGALPSGGSLASDPGLCLDGLLGKDPLAQKRLLEAVMAGGNKGSSPLSGSSGEILPPEEEEEFEAFAAPRMKFRRKD